MKNNILIASLIIFINFIYGQDYDGDSLISLPSLTNSEMLSIDTNTVNQGALVYNSDFKKVFQYLRLERLRIGSVPSRIITISMK